jgi:hypothetical protein
MTTPAAVALAVLVAAAPPVDFGRDVLPILSDKCFHCHGPDPKTRKGDLRLDTPEGALGKTPGTGAVVPGKSGESELYRRIVSTDPDERMPPSKADRTLSATQIDTLKSWIDQGAAWGKHWAFVPPTRPTPPAVRDPARARSGLDAFVLDRLDREGLTPSPEAPRATLVRRLTLDLTGLPPTPEDVDAFVSDPRPDAYERLVDRLLASPRYGERMALEWLDAARYADSNGYQGDRTRVMWPWRDRLVRALNAGQPFDQFTTEQLAGDLLPQASLEQRIASGFHRNHMLNGEGGRIAEESRVDYVVDRVDTTATVWLGLTLGCARCHDHKYDPFTQTDYYRLYAYFNQMTETGGVDAGGNANPVLPLYTPAEKADLAKREARVAGLERRLAATRDRAVTSDADWDRRTAVAVEESLKKARQDLDAANRKATAVMVMDDRKPRDTFVLIRGAYDKPGAKVTAGTPATLSPSPAGAPANRLGLAHWLTSPDHPLTARVAVNRVWQQFFGVGLVKTSDDFGVQGEKPSHPELLDWLATEFVRSGWDVKRLHRLIVTSATYRQSSRVPPALAERDPENRLLARGPRYRLPSGTIRDQALAASGLLVERLGGPPVYPYQPPGVWEEMTFGKIKYTPDHGESLYRRSMYTFWRRTVGPTPLFDSSPRQTCVVKPSRTNTPLHALTVLNDVTYVEASRALAARAMREAGPDPASRLERLFRLAVGRRPADAERAVLAAGLERLRSQYHADPAAAAKFLAVGESKADPSLDAAELAAYAGVAGVVLNLDEVLCKE